MKSHIETERKYIIMKPTAKVLTAQDGYTASDIEQIYLNSDAGVTHRIRKRTYADRVEYTETLKVRISAASSVEEEREITADEYGALKANIRKGSRPVIKTRHTFVFLGQLFEIDVYPEWSRTAIMETELESEDTAAVMPDFIKIVKEVTGNKGYSNASMSKTFPKEQA